MEKNKTQGLQSGETIPGLQQEKSILLAGVALKEQIAQPASFASQNASGRGHLVVTAQIQ